jgi:hypothetical protein
MSDQRPSDEQDRVVPFRRRDERRGFARSLFSAGRPPVDDLSQYERTDERDDYRHRMIINAFAFGATVLLIVIGIWIANKMADLRRYDECIMQGRRNCAPVQTPARDRY